MKFIRVIKSRWGSNGQDEFSSFQEALAYELKNGGDVYEDLFWLGAHLWDLAYVLGSIDDYDFLNSRTKKILKGGADGENITFEFEEMLNKVFYYVYEDLDLSGAQTDGLPQNLEQFINKLSNFHTKINRDFKDLKTSINNIPDYGSKTFKTKVINDINKLDAYITKLFDKYNNYLNQEYNKDIK